MALAVKYPIYKSHRLFRTLWGVYVAQFGVAEQAIKMFMDADQVDDAPLRIRTALDVALLSPSP